MKPTLNLATRTYINRRALYAGYGLVFAVLLLVLVFQAAVYLRSRAETERLEEHLAALESRVAAERAKEVEGFSPQAMEELKEEIIFANGILRRDAFRWTALLDHLEELMPKEVLVSSIQPDYAERSVRLLGVAREVKDLRRFLDNLIATPEFKDVFLLQQDRVEKAAGSGGRPGIGYSIVLKGAF